MFANEANEFSLRTKNYPPMSVRPCIPFINRLHLTIAGRNNLT
jgi:hypothetical protein